jgi:hypothetical protein
VWADPVRLAARLRDAAGASPRDPWWLALLDARPSGVRAEVDLGDAERVSVKMSLSFDPAHLPPLLGALEGAASPDASLLARDAARYAVPGETIVAAGTSAHAAKVVEAMLRSLPPEHQALAEDALAQAGESVRGVAADLAHYLQDGVGFLVARLPEAATIQRAQDEPGAVHAIPATTVVFRLREKGADALLVAAVRKRAKILFDAELGDRVEDLPGGARLHVLERHGLGGQWELLRPAFAADGDRFLFSTHEAHLRRALAAGRAGAAAPEPPAARTFVAQFRADPLRALLDDLRWEAADRATFHDWVKERAAVEASMRGRDPVGDADRVDEEMARRVERRRTEEVPAAAAAWREKWRWLLFVADGDVSAELKDGVLVVEGRVGVAGK